MCMLFTIRIGTLWELSVKRILLVPKTRSLVAAPPRRVYCREGPRSRNNAARRVTARRERETDNDVTVKTLRYLGVEN